MRAWWALLAAAACHGKAPGPLPVGHAAVAARTGSGASAPAMPPPAFFACAETLAPASRAAPSVPCVRFASALGFPAGTRSLRLIHTVGVRLAPADDAKRIGTLSIDTQVAWTATAPGKGCDAPWIELVPHGWICGTYVVPSDRPPDGEEVPRLDEGEDVPGVYGKVVAKDAKIYRLDRPDRRRKKHGKPHEPLTLPAAARMVEEAPVVGSMMVRRYADLDLDGRHYWKIDPKADEYVLASDVHVFDTSSFAGTRLGDDTGLTDAIGFVWPHGGGDAAPVTAEAAGGAPIRHLRARTPVPVLETARDAGGAVTAYRIGDGAWLSAADLHVFHPEAPPDGLGPGERWIDIDLDDQILVAYEGTQPVYATLVSSGAKATATETGLYRVWMKESEADMKGLGGEDPYSVATVPWTQFFAPLKGLALHTAYWHDEFGRQLSHGCVNLAPRDARWLYFWSDPQVPPGWTMAQGTVELPGSIVRVRSAADPTPEVKGYAKEVIALRGNVTASN